MQLRRLIAIAAIVGCGPTTDWMQLRSPPRTMRSRPIGSVEVFMSQMPDRRYVEVGILSETEGGINGPAEYVMQHIRREAAERGCDGLLLNLHDTTTSSISATRFGVFASSGTEREFRAICIMYM